MKRAVGIWGMAKSGGDKMQAAGQKRAAAGEQRKSKGAAEGQAKDVASLQREAERLQQELAAERERVRALQDTNDTVARRLDAAIESVKAIIAKQG